MEQPVQHHVADRTLKVLVHGGVLLQWLTHHFVHMSSTMPSQITLKEKLRIKKKVFEDLQKKSAVTELKKVSEYADDLHMNKIHRAFGDVGIYMTQEELFAAKQLKIKFSNCFSIEV